uniref:ABC transporter domain-containing protein n=1 Tax=Peronospora matthiolae TaxID=2874970 RepID=A0AAV1U8R7_9STRA
MTLADESDSSKGMAINYDDGKTLLAEGPQALHDHVASRMEKSLGKALPQMEVRFKDVSITADIMVKDETNITVELPTLINVITTGIREMRSSKHVVKKEILRNVSGVFKPGTITLVLGQPGSGKSSLMKLISGRFPDAKNITRKGEVRYNGTPAKDLRKCLPQFVSYVAQRDKHYPLLTVKETLEFAHACCGGGLSKRDEQHLINGSPEENKAALDAARAMFKHYPDIVIQQLGLENCQNTIVGDAMTRGVSGGERKRVTTGEMEFGNKYVMMMDEISTGLDSAATFDIITTQRSLAKKFRKTIVISLLQPSPEVFELFDDVIMNEGYQMYHGPRAEALSYFESLGFKCPPHRDVADFLLDLGTDKQAQYEVEDAGGISIPRSAGDFAAAFERSSTYDRMRTDLEDPVHPGLIQDKKVFMDIQPEFHQNFWDSTRLLMTRQIRLTLRDSAALFGRLFMNTVMGLLYASVFYQIDPTNAQLVIGVIFASVLSLSLGQSAQIPTVMAAREVFYKQRGASFFRTASYVLSFSGSQILPIILESVVFGCIVYWMCGLVDTIGSFFLFLLMLIMTNFAFTAFFFFLASAAPNFSVANPISSVSTLFFILFGGFVITKEQIPDYLIWLYWINPIAWCVRALAVNQYRDSTFDTCVYGDINFCESFNQTVGEYSLGTFEVPSEEPWLWLGIAYLGGAYFFFMFLSYVALEYNRYESPENVTLTSSEDKSDTKDGYGLMATPRGSTNGGDAAFSVAPASEKLFVPVTLAFKDLWYSVPDPSNPKGTIDLLKGINGYALPGTITALMGSSGAGKTTLMDVIAGRKTGGTIGGHILLNGVPATDLAIRRSTGYCEQMDIHCDSTTFREALTFSAFLRQGADVPDSHKYDSVDECLELLDLNPIADQIVRGSSVEQMKRLTIGVELAAQPSVLFLDEPTSGLDARSAKLIMDGVRKVANTGRTVVCTIHQPSTEVFSVFDSLLLLKRGGETVFAGELGQNACEMIAYFESIEGVEKLPENYNAATWMLEVIGAGVGNSNGAKDFVKVFQESRQFEMLQTNLDRDGVTRPSADLPELIFTDKRAATELVQMKMVMQRFFRMYWRTASFNLTRFFVSLVLGILFGITYVDAEYTSFTGINSGMGMLYLTVAFLGISSFNSSLPIASQERGVFYRERAAQTYNAFWYFFSSSMVEIPYTFFAVMLFMIPFYPMVGFTGASAFFTFWFAVSMHVLLQGYIGEFLVFLLPNVEVAQILGSLMALVFLLFMGFTPPAGDLPTGYKWLYHITPQKYTFAVVSSLVFGDCPSDGVGSDVGCQFMTNVPPSLPADLTVKSYLESVFLVEHSEIWQNNGIVLAFLVFFRVLTLLAMRFVNHQKR